MDSSSLANHGGWLTCFNNYLPTRWVVKTVPTYYVSSIYSHSSPLLFNLRDYRLNLLLIEWVTKMRPGSNSVEDHPQLSHNRHPVDGVLVGSGLLWPLYSRGDCIKTSNLELCERTT